ncbi:MAG: DUF5682 family protein [Saprospiraceae bacterium]
MSNSAIKVFGIRHHGPGSARRLLRALDNWQPDCVIIEFPADAQRELETLVRLDLTPPVALVLYDQQDIQQAFYYPFAVFSPEWQALQWAHQHSKAVVAMDLPSGMMLERRRRPDLWTGHSNPLPALSTDPLGEIASLAGYTDKEQWWDTLFEREADDSVMFDAIMEMMTALRSNRDISADNLLREAHMRKTIRQVLKEQAPPRIAVVCGAWHGPALQKWAQYPPAADQRLLKGLPKAKMQAAWIPWSYPRLSKEDGYGAGVVSPAWYEWLFYHHEQAVPHWMVRAAQLLREQGWEVSPAHAQEGVRLTTALAALQDEAVPSLSDLQAAALSTLCEGRAARWSIVEKQLVLGTQVGQVPEQASAVPLQKDLNEQLKSSRLNKYWGVVGAQWLKATQTNPQGGIDLREPTDLHKSQLLHQLLMVGIPWGKLLTEANNDLGGFRERWHLDWQPEFSLQVLAAAMWGNTLQEAASRQLQQVDADDTLAHLAEKMLLGLKAGLQVATGPLVRHIQDRAALTRDVPELLAAMPPLIRTIQYGDSRKTDVTALALLVSELIPRLAAGLPSATCQIDEDNATVLLHDLIATHRGLQQLALPLLDSHWWPALHQLTVYPGVAPLLNGAANRLLLDFEQLPVDKVAVNLHYALSGANTPLQIAGWLEGLLHGSGLILLHHPTLWALVNDWVAELPFDTLEQLLPQLRRTFSRFSPGERQQMLRLAQQPPPTQETTADAAPLFEADIARKLLQQIDSWM